METLTFLMTSSFYPPYHIGGDAIHVKYLAEELVKHGHEVHVMHSLDACAVKRKDMAIENGYTSPELDWEQLNQHESKMGSTEYKMGRPVS